MEHGAHWDYIVITEDFQVSGTNDAEEARKMAANCTVVHINYDDKEVAMLDTDGDITEIRSL